MDIEENAEDPSLTAVNKEPSSAEVTAPTDAAPLQRAALEPARLRQMMAETRMGELWISEQTGSTNDDLAARIKAALPANLSVETTEHQRAGHGRLGRGWESPARSSLASSIVFRTAPSFEQKGLPWLSMLCAVAMVHTLREDAGLDAGLKWPNDVVAEGKKVCGVLAQLVMTEQGPVVVVGAGLNVSTTAAELPVPTAASLATLGAKTLDRTLLLGGYLRRVAHLYRSFERVGGNANVAVRYGTSAPGGYPERQLTLRELVSEVMVSLGQQVDAFLPDGTVLRGRAVELDADGSLLLRTMDNAEHHVLAGDIQHLRRSDGSYA